VLVEQSIGDPDELVVEAIVATFPAANEKQRSSPSRRRHRKL